MARITELNKNIMKLQTANFSRSGAGSKGHYFGCDYSYYCGSDEPRTEGDLCLFVNLPPWSEESSFQGDLLEASDLAVLFRWNLLKYQV